MKLRIKRFAATAAALLLALCVLAQPTATVQWSAIFFKDVSPYKTLDAENAAMPTSSTITASPARKYGSWRSRRFPVSSRYIIYVRIFRRL